jgi:large conductance mechanosensitive channel
MLKEFREFAVKGNMVDLAIGVIIGAAFGRIVTSLVEDILMPPIGRLLGSLDFSNYFLALDGGAYANLADAKAVGAPTLNYGLFLTNVINFLIVAFVLFLIIRQINRMKRQPPPVDINLKDCPYCATKIALKATRCPACTSQLEQTP